MDRNLDRCVYIYMAPVAARIHAIAPESNEALGMRSDGEREGAEEEEEEEEAEEVELETVLFDMSEFCTEDSLCVWYP